MSTFSRQNFYSITLFIFEYYYYHFKKIKKPNDENSKINSARMMLTINGRSGWATPSALWSFLLETQASIW